MLLLLAFALSQGLDLSRDSIVGEKQAFIMLPPDVVCGGKVDTLAWSPDGKTLALVRETNTATEEAVRRRILGESSAEPPSSMEVWLWNLQSRSGRAVFRGRSDEYAFERFEWIGNSTIVTSARLLREDAPAKQLWLIKSGGVRPLQTSDIEWSGIDVSPTHDVGLLTHGSTVRFFDSTGRIGQAFDVGQPVGSAAWVDARPAIPVWKVVNGRRRIDSWRVVDRRTGALTLLAGDPPQYSEERRLDIVIKNRRQRIELTGGTAHANAVSVGYAPETPGSDSKDALVTADGGYAAIAPGSRAIAYIHEGVAMVRRLVAVPKDAYQKAVVVEGAKQVGVALLMYSMDADELFPPNTGWQDITMPYIKDMGLLNSFTYTFPGGKLPEGTEPSTFQIGFMSGPGGRAIVYADGSVKWQK